MGPASNRPSTWRIASEKSGRADSNGRPPGPKPGALTKLRYAPSLSPLYSIAKPTRRTTPRACGFGVAAGLVPAGPPLHRGSTRNESRTFSVSRESTHHFFPDACTR